MRKRSLFCLLLVCAVGVFLTACDLSSQNVGYQVGESLVVNGPSSLTLSGDGSGVSGEYQVRAFTIKKDYTWSVSPSPTSTTRKRKGENLVVTFSEPGTYEVTVTTTIDGEETSGTKTTEVKSP